MTEVAISVRNLSKRRGRILALNDVSLTVAKGQFYALLGANGAGKTTLINCMTTMSQADHGTVEICGIDSRQDPKALRRKFGVVFQEQSLDAHMTLRENLEFHARIYKMPWRLGRAKITEMLALAGLEERANTPVRSLSGGMRRRLEIVRALLHDPEILFLDEPTIGLDPQARQSIWAYIHALRAVHANTLLVTTHYIEEVEQSDCVCILDRGNVIAQDSPAALRARYGRAAIRMRLAPHLVAQGITHGASATGETPPAQGIAAEILASYPEARLIGRDILLPRPQIGDAERALSDQAMQRWQGGLQSVALEQPTLESAFIAAIAGHAGAEHERLKAPQSQPAPRS